MIYTAFFIAVKSYPNLDAYTKLCFMLNQIISALL